MFISPKQAGQGLVTLGVAALTYVGTKKMFDTYNNFGTKEAFDPNKKSTRSPTPFKQAEGSPEPIAPVTLGTYQKVALHIITAASAIIFANYIGLISLNNLAARFSTLFGTSAAETAEKVNAVATGETPVDPVDFVSAVVDEFLDTDETE